ncbi:hypothetical protein GW916_04625 [bacterium]|nr:hypothetical protein [bacterium]
MKKSHSTKRLSNLCTELKARLDALDDMEQKAAKKEAQNPGLNRKRLFKELKEKLETVS